ncbi:MAG: bifunctional phosphoglucose/phosphomannose isomerase [Candidatus Bipolaricaulaceae bacterium]
MLDWGNLLVRDVGRMAEALRGFPEQVERALGLACRVPNSLQGFKNAVVLGMGGSAIAGDILARFSTVPVVTVRDYAIPAWVNADTLLIAISYSGETEETLSAFREGLRRTRRAVALTTGGALAALCEEQDVPWIPVPPGFQPRAALAFLLFPLLGCFARLGYVRENPTSVIAQLRKLRDACVPEQNENSAQDLAQTLVGKIPVVYGAGVTAPVAYRWKTQINENAKQPAHWAELPELCHNEIVGYELAGKVFAQGVVIFLRTSFDHPRVAKRVEILKEVLAARGLAFLEVWGEGETPLTQALWLLYFGDWVSFYLALLNGVDPTPVQPIQELKRRLKGP